MRKAEIVFRDAQAQEQEERDNLLEEFTRRREQNTQLEIYQDTWLELRSALTGYHTPADWSPIRNQLDECVRRCESVVQQKRIQADGALSALQKEYTELEYHLRQIKSQPEPVPPRRESVQAARLQLMLRGVPCAPLYEIIDFSPETSQETRDLLEAQLLDSGLLDALVVSEEHLLSSGRPAGGVSGSLSGSGPSRL